MLTADISFQDQPVTYATLKFSVPCNMMSIKGLREGKTFDRKKTVKQTGISFARAVAFHLFIIAFFLSLKRIKLQLHKLISFIFLSQAELRLYLESQYTDRCTIIRDRAALATFVSFSSVIPRWLRIMARHSTGAHTLKNPAFFVNKTRLLLYGSASMHSSSSTCGRVLDFWRDRESFHRPTRYEDDRLDELDPFLTSITQQAQKK